MGVHPLDLDDWLVVDERFDDELARKQRLSSERHDEVFLARPGSEAAGAEVLELVRDWLTTHRGASTTSIEPDLHPLDAAGRLVPGGPVRDGARVAAATCSKPGSVCFPSHWRLADKLGRSVAEIHGPVHHYDHELEARVDHFFERLRPDHPVVRRNLSIHNHDELFRPEPHESPESFAPDVSGVGQVWLRSERQTLVGCPAPARCCSPSRPSSAPPRALAERPDIAHRLAAKLRGPRTRPRRHRRDRSPSPPGSSPGSQSC